MNWSHMIRFNWIYWIIFLWLLSPDEWDNILNHFCTHLKAMEWMSTYAKNYSFVASLSFKLHILRLILVFRLLFWLNSMMLECLLVWGFTFKFRFIFVVVLHIFCHLGARWQQIWILLGYKLLFVGWLSLKFSFIGFVLVWWLLFYLHLCYRHAVTGLDSNDFLYYVYA